MNASGTIGDMSVHAAMLSAGDVEPSNERYVVTHPHKHRTLKLLDTVVMTEAPSSHNFLLRLSDMTLHGLQDDFGQYVHLARLAQ